MLIHKMSLAPQFRCCNTAAHWGRKLKQHANQNEAYVVQTLITLQCTYRTRRTFADAPTVHCDRNRPAFRLVRYTAAKCSPRASSVSGARVTPPHTRFCPKQAHSSQDDRLRARAGSRAQHFRRTPVQRGLTATTRTSSRVYTCARMTSP